MTSTRPTNARCYTPDDFKNVGAISIQGIAAVEAVLESGKLFRYSDPNPKDSPAWSLFSSSAIVI